MTINDPEVIAELQVLYPRYEEALVSNDVNTLTAPRPPDSNDQKQAQFHR